MSGELEIVGGVVLVALIVLAALMLRREKSPPSWRRYRLGVFIEREPAEPDDE